ncbi:MAG: ABC transporter substrate-binding protein, partial [Chloroflexota bacterium]
MFNKKWYSLLALVIVLSLALAACAKTEEPTATPAPTQAPTQAPTTPSEEKVTIRLLSGAVGQELELTQAAAQRYMDAHPNVTIEVFDTPDAVQDRLGVYLQYFETQSA